MGTYITEDFVVNENEVRRYTINTDNDLASAFIVSDYDAVEGQVRYEPNIINYGEIHLDPGEHNTGSLFHYSASLSWNHAVFENHGLISAILPEGDWVRIISGWGQLPKMLNSGTMIARSGGDAEAVRADSAFSFTNDVGGVIETSGVRAASAFNLLNRLTLVNHGRLSAHVEGGWAFPDSENARTITVGLGNLAVLNLENSGLIEATGTSTSQTIQAVFINSDGGFKIINSGTIRGTDAIFQQDLGRSATGDGVIRNSGLLDGNVTTAWGADKLFNTGEIDGAVNLGEGDDYYYGSNGTVSGVVDGGGGNDTLVGGRRSETIFGGLGDDDLDGGDGIDTAIFSGKRSAYTIEEISPGVFRITGADGTDTVTNVEFAQFDNVTVELSVWTPPPGSIVGTAEGEILLGTAQADEIYGLGGNDTIRGRAGNDLLVGGEGHDTLDGSDGDDELDGGSGNDFLAGKAGADLLIGGAGDDIYLIDEFDTILEYAGEGTEEVRMFGFGYTLGENLENLRIRGGAVNGTGNSLDNQMRGSENNNVLAGLDGNDFLDGKGGLDTLRGGNGDDVLIGGDARDVLTGGAGKDRFVWRDISEGNASQNFADTITDFSQAQGDRIKLSDIDAISGGSDDAFTFIGKEAFSGTAGELRFKYSGGDTIVQMDVDGDGAVDMSIRLTGLVDLSAGDFIL